MICDIFFFFFQAEDGIRDIGVTGVQTCALPISQTVTIVRLGDEAALLGVVMIAMADSPQLGERPVVSRIYSDIGAHAGTQGGIAIPARNSDANRNSLHDLDPVATGVLRRKNGELGPASGRNRLDLPAPR